MSTNRRLNRKLPERVRREDTPGIHIDSGPFIGIIKNNVDPTRSGRLQVWIPTLGGSQDDPKNWRTVNYASPYYGTTFQPDSTKNNKFSEVQHSYGLWAVVPDIDNQVICTFISGDPNKGYWFACINPNLSHYMVPALGSSENVDLTNTDGNLKTKYNTVNSVWPVTEFNQNNLSAFTPDWTNNKKPPHEFQANVLINQGLDRDGIRGAINSSSQRESPSTVFGISTPGRPINDPKDKPGFAAKAAAGTLTEADYAIRGRKGGHTFVMDDGEQRGGSQLMRFRTAGGHQILMNDSERVMYLANSDGTVWMEFTGGGHVNVYSAKGINMRTEGDFNLHADKNINIQSGGAINFKSIDSIGSETKNYNIKASTSINAQGGKIGFLSSGELNIQSAGGGWNGGGSLILKGGKIELNTSSPGAVDPVESIPVVSQPDTSWDAQQGLWISKDGVYESISTITPSHEPWARGPGKGVEKVESQFEDPPKVEKQSSVCEVPPTTTNPGIKGITPSGNSNEQILESALTAYGITDTTQFASIMAQCAHESGNFKYLTELGQDSYFAKYEGRKDLGNTQPGDGLKYKGRGFIQITGRDLYTKAGAYVGQDLVNNPEIAAQPQIAAKLVLYFLFEYKKGRTVGVNWDDLTAVTRIVNGGTNGIEDRRQKYAAYKKKYTDGVILTGSGSVLTSSDGQPVKSGASQLDPGPESAKGRTVQNPAPLETMNRQNAPRPGGINSTISRIPGLLPTQLKAVMIQIGYAETKLNYSAENTTTSRIGAYQINAALLKEYGYVKPDYVKQYGNAAILRDDAYTGKNGINSKSSFLSNNSIQDNLMETVLKDYYSRMATGGFADGIQPGDDICTVAGMLCVAYFYRDKERLFGGSAATDYAKLWRQNGPSQGNADTPFNYGRYAIDVLSVVPATVAPSTAPVTKPPTTTNINPDDIFIFGGASATRESFDKLDGKFKDAILRAGKEYKEKTGKKIRLASAYRSPEEQEALYNRWLAAGGNIPNKPTADGITTPAKPATLGGRINAHGGGVAIDAGQQAAEINATINLAQYGLKWGGEFRTPDKVHIQLATFT